MGSPERSAWEYQRQKKMGPALTWWGVVFWEGYGVWKLFAVGFALLKIWRFWVFVILGPIFLSMLAVITALMWVGLEERLGRPPGQVAWPMVISWGCQIAISLLLAHGVWTVFIGV
jgi:hypothetical protein